LGEAAVFGLLLVFDSSQASTVRFVIGPSKKTSTYLSA
jgi:hypothetical protein